MPRLPPADPDATDNVGQDLRTLYHQEAPRLLRFFRRRSVDKEDSPDLVQEAFLRFLRAGAQTSDRPVAYLHRIARNLLFDRSRRQARRRAVFDAKPLEKDAASVPPDQAYAIEASQLMQSYQQAVNTLPPRTREVFLLHRVEELSYRQIAERLGIGLRTVEWHLAEALVRIRQTLDDV